MSVTGVALLSYVSWTIVLVLSMGALRCMKVMTGGRAANSFSPTGDDLPGLGQRLTRAHANCYENLPIAGAVMLYAIATQQTALTDGLAYLLLAARIGQSIVHIISASNFFVLVRFGLYAAQLIILVIWLLKLFHHI